MQVKNDFDDLFYAASEKYSVPFDWLKAIAGTESDWTPDAYRAEPAINDASYGLMQLLYKTAYALGYRGNPEGLYDPETNIDLGAKLIRENIDRFGEDFKAVYSAYNSGSPTKYKTSSEVSSHVDRALRYLAAVDQSTVIVNETGESDSGTAMALGAAALLIGVIVFFIFKG